VACQVPRIRALLLAETQPLLEASNVIHLRYLAVVQRARYSLVGHVLEEVKILQLFHVRKLAAAVETMDTKGLKGVMMETKFQGMAVLLGAKLKWDISVAEETSLGLISAEKFAARAITLVTSSVMTETKRTATDVQHSAR
jgi:hypothetical protein